MAKLDVARRRGDVACSRGRHTHPAEDVAGWQVSRRQLEQDRRAVRQRSTFATTGAMVMPLEKGADPAALKSAGWNPVTTIKMKGRDGTTDIYGVMYKPSDFDPSKKYPIINQIYPGPQQGSNSQ